MAVLTTNKKAYFDYQILDRLEAGIVLAGSEVKSAKAGQVNLKGSFVTIKNNEPCLVNCHISAYQSAQGYNPARTRKLLLNKKEIRSLIGKAAQKGLTLIPLSIYTKNGFVKVEIGLGKGKKKSDKREILRKKAINRDIRQALRGK